MKYRRIVLSRPSDADRGMDAHGDGSVGWHVTLPDVNTDAALSSSTCVESNPAHANARQRPRAPSARSPGAITCLVSCRINAPYFLKEKSWQGHGSMAYPQGISSLPTNWRPDDLPGQCGRMVYRGRNPYKTFSTEYLARHAYLNSGYHRLLRDRCVTRPSPWFAPTPTLAHHQKRGAGPTGILAVRCFVSGSIPTQVRSTGHPDPLLLPRKHRS